MSNLWLIAGAVLLASGLTLIISTRNILLMLFGVELMFNAANLNLIYFDSRFPESNGQLMALFVIIIAVCEAAVGLALVLRIYRQFSSTDPLELNQLKDE